MTWDEPEGAVMADVVNLDALLLREDFLATEGVDAGSQGKTAIFETDLRKGEMFLSTLRKPDFQRETAAWSPNTIRDFVEAFVEGELIPAVICWQSPSRLSFVIDGAHRLSAIIAWLTDDYGDGDNSVKFYDNNIPAEQRRLADKTKQLINETIGKYADFRAAASNPGSNPALELKARALAHAQIPLLWVKGSDSKKAEKAFLTINQKATVIDPTELKILNDRFKPNAIVARSIVRNATGFRYWATFSEQTITKIEVTSKEIYRLLYKPELNQPIRSIDLPVAGHGYGSQTLPLIFDFVNISNGIAVTDVSRSKGPKLKLAEHTPPVEEDTLRVLGATVKIARMFTGDHPSSLGLHPAVYFYSSNGRHQPTAVLAMAQFVKDLLDQNKLLDFCAARSRMESFLVSHKMYINQLTSKYGSMTKGFRHIRDYFWFIFEHAHAGKNESKIEAALADHERFQILVKEKPILTKKAKAFSADAKQLKLINDTLASSLTCAYCDAKIDSKSMHLDHAKEKADGGLGVTENAEWAHPYCDSTYKTYKASLVSG
ncbi:DUF262 domain-containing protein [Tardiphaga sp.]|uniref:HNH endonuclease family protein n=1 Tax=Tardiphaga sp. TaxID=1926292 RepID=UPI002601F2C3|nr:DUF262 domain-containing protein [Tardiphaga sp.]MDB5616040.1 hypothetical protein [Tardiphaga sp.]